VMVPYRESDRAEGGIFWICTERRVRRGYSRVDDGEGGRHAYRMSSLQRMNQAFSGLVVDLNNLHSRLSKPLRVLEGEQGKHDGCMACRTELPEYLGRPRPGRVLPAAATRPIEIS
jgi:hypothetical protein